VLVDMYIADNSPLGKPHAEASEYLKGFTPIGVNMEEVLDFIENDEKWELQFINDSEWIKSSDTSITLGSKYLVARTTNGNIFKMSVFGSWIFDENDELIEIAVQRGR